MNINQFFKLYFRNFRKDLVQNIIKISGLAVGLTCTVLVFLFLQEEINYDRQYPDHKSIYRYGAGMSIGGPQTIQSSVNPAVGPVIKQYVPEIKDFFRYRRIGEVLLKIDERKFYENNFAFCDSSVIDILSIKLISGDPSTVLDEPYSIVLSKSVAEKIFGNTNPVGKQIELDSYGDYQVTGVMEDMPTNTHLDTDAFMSFHTQYVDNPEVQSPRVFFGNMNTSLYFRLQEGADPQVFKDQLERFYNNHLKEIDPINYVSFVEPIKDYRLNSVINSSSSRSNRGYFFAFLSIGLVILILAGINYVNISTTSSINRAKEISLKKVNGSRSSILRLQFTAESYISVLFSLIMGLSIAELILSFTDINNVLNKSLTVDLLHNSGLLVFSIVCFVAVGFLAGWYPSVVMARTKPIEFLKGNYSRTGKGKKIRTILVGFQFVLSISAIIIILLMDSQLKYLINSDIGFDNKNLMIIRARNDEVVNSMESFRQEISRYAGIESTTFAYNYPGRGVSGQAFNWETEEGEMKIHAFPAMWVEREFPHTLGLQIVEGDNFDNFSETDTIKYFLVNEALVREMGWTSAVGKKNEMGTVIGVVKDFNHNSLHQPLQGAFICLYPVPKNNLGIKIKEGSETAAIEYIKEKWSDFAPGIPMSYSFLEDDIDSAYSSDKDQQKLLGYLAFICIIISGLGLFGVTAQNMNNKLKEVTIRKVFGAEKIEVISVLFKNIIYLIGTAMILAIPITIWLYSKWIQNFASQVDIKVVYFLIADLGVLLFTLVLSSYHGLQVMNSKPMDKLRYE